MRKSTNLHKEALEKFVQIPLSGRISEVPNVETATLCHDGVHSFDLSVGALAISVGRVRVRDSGSSQGVGDLVNSSRHIDVL